MADSTLPSLTHSAFPQVFTSAIDRMVEQITAKPQLGICWFEDEHCNCHELATVHFLETEQEFCARHFEQVSRG